MDTMQMAFPQTLAYSWFLYDEEVTELMLKIRAFIVSFHLDGFRWIAFRVWQAERLIVSAGTKPICARPQIIMLLLII